MAPDEDLLNLNACPASSTSTINLWENPTIPGINNLAPHSRSIPSICSSSSSSTTLRLDRWQFRLFPNPTCIPKRYLHDDDDDLFSPVSVPHCWPMTHHLDPPRYTNVRMPFKTEYRQVPSSNPAGLYRCRFPYHRTRDHRVILHLGGVESCCFVFLNGEFVGMGKDSRLPVEFDVGSLLEDSCDNDNDSDTNVLAVVVVKWSDGSFLEQQDHWRGMGGIHRQVFLYPLPVEAHVEDVFCRATVLEELQGDGIDLKCKGVIRVDARFGRSNVRAEERDIYYNENIPFVRMVDDAHGGRKCVEYRMLFQLYDDKGSAMFEQPLDVTNPVQRKNFTEIHTRSHLVSFSAPVPGLISPWSDESPTLYTLETTLLRVDSTTNQTQTIHTITTIIGFRSIEIKHRQLLINGRPVLLRGVNRHDHSPTRAKAVTRNDIHRDLTLMKEYNFNAIRTAHYPNDTYLYDLADELGLYVVDEANIECHGHYDMICREHSYAAAMLDRVQRMVVRDQNHPCIIGFSLGNEAGFAMNQTMLYGWIKGYDDSRFVQYEGAIRPRWGQLPHVYDRKDSVLGTDVICPMYPSIDDIIEWADVIAPRLNEQRPMILCEYAHAMGNSSGSLHDYWKVIKSKHGVQGGFIWDWIDQGLEEKDTQGRRWYAYGGDYGDSPHDANFNINGMIGPDRTPHPAMMEFKKIAQPVDFELEWTSEMPTVRVFNRRYFTSIDDLRGVWTLKIDGFVCDEGSFSLPLGLSPGNSSLVTIPSFSDAYTKFSTPLLLGNVPEFHLDIQAISISTDACVGSDQLIVIEGNRHPILGLHLYRHLKEDGCPAVEWNGNDHEISVRANDHALQVSEEEATLHYFRTTECTSTTLLNGLRLNLFRAGTDNDGVKQLGHQFHDKSKPLGRWLSMGLDSLGFLDLTVNVDSRTVPDVDPGGTEHSTTVTKATVVGRPGHTSYEGIAIAEHVLSSEHTRLGTMEQAVTMLGDGSLFIDIRVELDETIKDIPRVGVELSIPCEFDDACFFANGPHENYCDRRYSAHAGVYEERVPIPDCYVVPQEQGNRTGLRWVFLSKRIKRDSDTRTSATPTGARNMHEVLQDKSGLLLVPTDPSTQFTLSRFTDAQIFSARHVHELDPSFSESIYVRLDAAQRGLGSGSCGPQTLEEYRVDGGSYRISFWLKHWESITTA